MVPKGYILFTESGARLALKYQTDAISYKNQLSLKDSSIVLKNEEIGFLTLENKRYRRQKVISEIEKWGMRIMFITKVFKLW